jgi:3-methylcrotonyl-CoA carboxylase alpha subunit
LAQTGVLGVATNLGFLARVVADADFAAARLDTGFVERRRAALLVPLPPVPDRALAAAVLLCLARGDREEGDDRHSPWARRDGWRLNAARASQTLLFRCGDEQLPVAATATVDGWLLQAGERAFRAAAVFSADGAVRLTLDGVQSRAIVLDHGDTVSVFVDGVNWRLELVDPLAPAEGANAAVGRLGAPMPGRVVQLLVAAGDAVRQGQALIIIEAMKMEHTIAAPRDGVVDAVRYAVGDLVEEGTELITLASGEGARR